MGKARAKKPRWTALYELAAGQGGYFRTKQAAEVGYSPQLLRSHILGGALVRPRRGIYRLAQFPSVENEDLVELWLWSDEEGVFSHETALALHALSDALPARVHMTVPRAWRKKRRRLSAPSIVVLHYADLPAADRTWSGLVPVTSPERTLRDALDDGTDPTIISQAVADGIARSLFNREDLRGIVAARRGRPPGRSPTKSRRAPRA